MKRICIALVAAALTAPSAFASFDGTITLTQNQYSYGNGGQFTAVTSGLGTFQTFCIEYNEEYQPGSQYEYYENSGAVAGDGGANTTDPHTGLSMDNISIGTAWLYSQFRAGTLANYFSSTVSVQKQNAGDLQVAIWYLEGEINTLTFNGADGTTFYNDAVTAAAALGKNVTDDSDGDFGVIALNLYSTVKVGDNQPVTINGTTYYASQDQLAIVPVPEVTTIIAGALLLLPLGASTLRILRRSRMV
jgi:hypothetical protein